MRASSAVGLLLVSSLSIFGIATSHRPSSTWTPDTIEPVWKNGQQGVISPSTGLFVAAGSGLYAATCDEIRNNRLYSGSNQPSGSTSSGYWSNGHYYYYNAPSGWSGGHGTFGGDSSASSARGGIGGVGHGFGHGGGE